MKLEELNYSDTVRLIEALKYHIYNRDNNMYNLDLLLKLERNKRILYETPSDLPNEVGE
jgi:hypothetical protein